MSFSGRRTDYEGLWWQERFQTFVSYVFDLSEIAKSNFPVRLCVTENKMYEDGKNNRPRFHFCLREADADNVYHLSFNGSTKREKLESCTRFYTEEEVRKIMKGVFEDVQAGCTDVGVLSPDDYV